MNNPPYFPVISSQNRSAFKIALLYLLIGSLWILFSDQLAAKIAPNQGALTLISIYKGWGYVVVTALILYWLIRRDNAKHKQAENRLHDSEQNYLVLLDQASDGIFIADAQGQYTLVNEEACRLLGYPKAELLSMNFRKLIAPEDLLINPPRPDELHKDQTLITERILLRKDGSRILCEISAKLLADGRYQSIIRDITERKATEDALKRSEKRYRSLFENMTNGFARCQMLYENDIPKDFIYLDINEAFKQLTGLQDVIGKRVSKVIPGIHESNPELIEIYGRVAATGKPEKFETYVPDLGSGIWFSVSAYSSEKGFFVAVFEVITERKQAEESLRRSYKQLLSFIEDAPLSIAMFDLDMNYLAISRRWILDYGRGHTDLIGRNHYDIHPDVPDYWREAHQKGLAGESLKNDDDLWIQADGTKNWLRWALTPWTDEHENVGGIIISTEDISERKRAEAAAFKSELRYQRILDALMEGCQIIDSDWRYVYVNEAVVQQGKRKPEEMLNHTMMEIYPGIEQTEMFSALRQCVEDRRPKRMENQFVFPDGSIEWFELSIQPAEQGLFILSTDITERKRAEEALRESEERLRLSLHAANQGLYDLNVQTGDAVVNREYAEMLGYDPDSFVETNAAWIERLHPDDREITAKAYTNYINSLTPEYRVEFRQRTKDGGWKWILSLGKVVEYDVDGKPLRMLGTHTNITERKRAEETLQQSEEKYHALFQNAQIGMYQSKLDGSAILDVNKKLCEIFGYSEEEMIGNPATIRWAHPDARERMVIELQKSGSLTNHEIDIITKGGETRTCSVSIQLYPDQGYIEGSAIDITERKQAEEKLRESEERYRRFFENMHETFIIQEVVVDDSGKPIDLRYLDVNPAAERFMGKTQSEIVGKTRSQLTGRLDSEGVEMANQVASTGTPFHWVRYSPGFGGWFESFTYSLGSGIVATLSLDITERKHAEAQIEYQAHLLANVSEAIIATDEKQIITSWNRAAENMYGWKTEEVLGKLAQEAIRSEFTEVQRAEAIKALKENGYFKVETLQYHRNGQAIWVEGHTIALRDDTGKLTGFVSVNRDFTERKQAGEALKNSEIRYRRLFETAKDGILILDADTGMIVDVNPFLVKLLGYSHDVFLGKTIWELGFFKDIAANKDNFLELQQKEYIRYEDLPLETANRRRINVEFVSNVYQVNHHKVVQCNIRDITERKQAEEKLRESEEHYRLLFESNPLPMWVDDKETLYFLAVNEAAISHYGFNRDEFLGMTIKDIRPPQEISGLLTNLSEPPKTEEWSVSRKHRKKDGTLIDVEVTSHELVFLGRQARLALVNDVTERKRAEEALRQSQENFVKAFNSNPAAIAITRLVDGKSLNVNPAYTRIMEYEPHELLDHTAAEMNIYVHPEERDQIVQQLREHGTVQNYELSVRIKSGETRSIVISMEPLLYNEEECILSVFIDISERQKMEAELRRSNAELEQFAYVSSHDLQEPLRAIAGMVQLLQQRYKGQLDERADEYIGHAVDASSRMQNLINDLLEYSRVDRLGKLFSETHLEKTLEFALANLQLAIQDSNAQITHDPLPMLMVDAGQMAQVFQNLIGNAIKFRGERPPHIHVSAERLENDWRFSVRDNGIGIEPQYFERIFLVFQRLHSRREYSGTGIGLALCKKIIERHGGQIWVASQPGQGSTFYFTIPTR